MTSHSLLSRVNWPSARISGIRRRTHTEALPARLTRYRGGTYSPTVDAVVFADGSSARTDLIRLNPSIAAYSLDIGGIAPTHPSAYQVQDWLAVANLRARTREPQVAWMLANSYPTLSTAQLSRRMRDAGYLGNANIKDHEAIAGTQAAIWFLTNGVELDTVARNVPISVRGLTDGHVRVELSSDSPYFVEFEFDGQPQLGGYALHAHVQQGPVTLRMHASADAITWREVSSSELTLGEGAARYGKSLGVGATTAETRYAAPDLGYRFFRLEVSGSGVLELDGIDFWLHGARHHSNADRVVQLYRYLLERSEIATQCREVVAAIDDSAAVMAAGLVGPFVVDSSQPVRLSLSSGARAMDISGAELSAAVPPGTRFYVRPADGADTVTVSVVDPEAPARVLTGVAEGPLTPLALVLPGAHERDEFTIEWAPGAGLSRVS